MRARGAPDAAAELLELALDLGGGDELRVLAAEHLFDAGELRRAQALLEQAIAGLGPGEPRAQALFRLGEIRYHDDSFGEARELLVRAQREAGDDERLHVLIELRLAFTLFNLGLPSAAARIGRVGARPRRALGHRDLLAQSLACSVIVDFGLGGGSTTGGCGVPSRSATLTRPWARSSSPR